MPGHGRRPDTPHRAGTASRQRRFGSMVPLSAGHAYAPLADARSSFGDTGGGGDGAPQRLISAWAGCMPTREWPARRYWKIGP